MEHIKDTELLIAFIFGVCGFITTFFLRRGMNFILLGVFFYASFKGLETLRYHPDWGSFNKFITILQQMGKILLTMISNILSTAGTFPIILFLLGGVTGLILSRKET